MSISTFPRVGEQQSADQSAASCSRTFTHRARSLRLVFPADVEVHL